MAVMKFAGASVKNYSSSGGAQGSTSQLDVTLVVDELNGDSFTEPPAGSHMVLEDHGFRFEGIVQGWTKGQDPSGYPSYNLTLQDVSDLLSGVQVILSGFSGGVSVIPNILNVFGYWQHELGFSGALSNESGMLWDAPFSAIGVDPAYGGLPITEVATVGLKSALEYLTNNSSSYGRPIELAGNYYGLDLSGLGTAPPSYRLGGSDSMSVIDIISQFCQDGGLDYILYLDNFVIKVRTIDRKVQPSLNAIKDFVDATENAKYKNNGIELRNDITNAVLIGGAIQNLYLQENPLGSNSIWPFWGTTPDGVVIVGEGDPAIAHTFELNGTEIADIMGQIAYPCDIPEIRCALVDYDSWTTYVLRKYPEKAETINLISCVDNDQYTDYEEVFGDVILQRDMVDYSDRAATAYGEMNEGEDNYWTDRAQRVYNFVRGYADLYGKKFLVQLPFQIYYSYEAETSNRIASEEPSDGGYIEGGDPLGLDFLNQQPFLTDDGRYTCFVRISDYTDVDLMRMSPDSYVVNGTGLFIKATIDTAYGVLYPPGSTFPYVVVDVANVAYKTSPTPLGDLNDIAQILDIDVSDLDNAIGLRYGSFPLRIHPFAFRPDAVTLPFKSNIESYGPWHSSSGGNAIGIAGKTWYQKDEGLTPWNYGSFAKMDEVAEAKIANIASGMQSAERGSVVIVDFPAVSLGELLVELGPNVTSIRVGRGESGWQTEYEFSSFTPKKVGFNEDAANKARRQSLGFQQARSSIRQLNQGLKEKSKIFQAAQLGFMQNCSRAVAQHTPHDVITANITYSAKYGSRTQIAFQTPQEAVGTVRGDNNNLYKRSAAMGLEGLLRPFSTKIIANNAVDTDTRLPHYQTAASGLPTNCLTNAKLDPFSTHGATDISVWGQSYPTSENRENRKALNGIHLHKGSGAYDDMRLIGLRSPILLSGPSFDINGRPVQNSVGSGTIDKRSNTFASGYMTDTSAHNVGVLDIAWDDFRKCYASRGTLFGKVVAFSSPTGTMQIQLTDTTYIPDLIPFRSHFTLSTSPSGGTKCSVGWNPYYNSYFLLGLGCP